MNLIVEKALLHKSQTCLWREERNQSVILVSVRDQRSGERGHVLYCVETDKRDVLEEEIWTDNPSLFATEHPEGDWTADLFRHVQDDTPKETDEETEKILAGCFAGSPVVYEEGSAGWGLYTT